MAKAIIQQQVDYLEVFRKSLIGVPMTFVAQEVPDAFMVCDGSLILFEDWPEFKAAYDAGKFSGMVLDAADSAQKGKMVLNGSAGVYLPDLEGLYEQASSAANAGGYLAAGLPNIKGVLGSGSKSGIFWPDFSGAFSGETIGKLEPDFTLSNKYRYSNANFSAAAYNPIYSDSINTVQPPSVRYVRAMYLGKPAAA